MSESPPGFDPLWVSGISALIGLGAAGFILVGALPDEAVWVTLPIQMALLIAGAAADLEAGTTPRSVWSVAVTAGLAQCAATAFLLATIDAQPAWLLLLYAAMASWSMSNVARIIDLKQERSP